MYCEIGRLTDCTQSAVLTIGRITTQQTTIISVKKKGNGGTLTSEERTGMKQGKLDLDKLIWKTVGELGVKVNPVYQKIMN